MLVFLINSCLLVAAVAWLWSCVLSRSAHNAVPVVPGLPLLGSVVALGRGGTAFISQCRQRFGDVFCVRVLHQRMVFIFDPGMLSLFFKAPEQEISFKPAVKQFTQRVYGLPSSEFFERHEPLLATLRQLLVPANLESMGQQLLEYAQPQLQDWKQQGKIELWAACKSLMFKSAGRVLFGEAFFARHGLDYVQQEFLTFEENFEVAASPVPHILLCNFRSSRRHLLNMFKTSLAAGDFEGTVVAQLLSGCGMKEQYWPNLLLAVLWASQANSMPALYWSLAFLLLPEQAKARERILLELRDALTARHESIKETPAGTRADEPLQELPLRLRGTDAPKQHRTNLAATVDAQAGTQPQQQGDPHPASVDADTAAAMLQLAMDKNSFVSRCVAEAVRLRLHSIAVRFVANDGLMLQASACAAETGQPRSDGAQPRKGPQRQYHVQRASILCICPIESHHDERLFPEDPWRFNPDRGVVQGLQPGTVVPSLAGMGYGGGFWRCPGRFFAEMELAVLLQLVLQQLQLEPEPRQPSQHAKPSADSVGTPSLGFVNKVGSLLPQAVTDMLVFGAGAFGGCQQQREQWGRSGDAQQLLPNMNLLRLVGFKVPHDTWWVGVSSARSMS